MRFLSSLLVATIVILASGSILSIGRTQSSGVKGRLTCDGRPAVGVKVKLYDDDRGVDSDDLMASGKTDADGYFELQGHTAEFTTIDPKLNIYHRCHGGVHPCKRKNTVMIPDRYVSHGKKPKVIYDAGTIELAGKFKGEVRDCLN